MIAPLLWLLVSTVMVTSSEKCEEGTYPYPTNYFEDLVPKFVNNRPMIGIAAMETMGQKMLIEVRLLP